MDSLRPKRPLRSPGGASSALRRGVLASAFALAGATGCVLRHGQSADRTATELAARGGVDPRRVGTLVLLGVELPAAGTPIGAHYQGLQFGARQFDYQLGTAQRTTWAEGAQQRGEALVRGAGYRLRSVGPASVVSQQIEEVRFGIQGHVASLEIRTFGQFEPYLVEVGAEVSWEVLDVSAGSVIVGRTTRGTARLTGSVDSAVAVALDQTLAVFLGDASLGTTLAAERPTDAGPIGRFARPPPESGEIIQLSGADLNPSGDSTPVGRVAQGVVSLRGPGGGYYGTAVLLTRDGLGLATMRSARAVRGARGTRAQLYSGVERPVRVVRANRTLGVALIQVACPGDCPTVDWESPVGVPTSTPVVIVGAASEGVGTLSVGRGQVGGQWGLARGVTLEGWAGGGEAVARAATGRVFGIAVLAGDRRIVLMIGEVLQGLRVRPPRAAAP